MRIKRNLVAPRQSNLENMPGSEGRRWYCSLLHTNTPCYQAPLQENRRISIRIWEIRREQEAFAKMSVQRVLQNATWYFDAIVHSEASQVIIPSSEPLHYPTGVSQRPTGSHWKGTNSRPYDTYSYYSIPIPLPMPLFIPIGFLCLPSILAMLTLASWTSSSPSSSSNSSLSHSSSRSLRAHSRNLSRPIARAGAG